MHINTVFGKGRALLKRFDRRCLAELDRRQLADERR